MSLGLSLRVATFAGAACAALALGMWASAQGVRDFTRSKGENTAIVTENQAAEVTLTLTDAQLRPIQTWVRAAAVPDVSGKVLTIALAGDQAGLVEPGQRLRAFSVLSRAQMQQGRISRVSKTVNGALVQAELASPLPGHPARAVVEIVTEAGPFLSIPNVAIVDEGDAQFVYLQQSDGSYVRREIETGIQGELYTQIASGLSEGDAVVSVGSFFIDADTKLKSTGGGMPSMPGMDHGSMAGMNHGALPMDAPPGGSAAPDAPLQVTMTEPAASSRTPAPMMIHVMFNHPVDPAKSTIDILTASGERIATDAPTSMGKEGLMLMIMPNSSLKPGAYQVRWKAIGKRNESAAGQFSFTVE